LKINDRPAVSARDLHDFLEVKTAYKDWFPRMCEYGFTEGEDFNPLKIERVQIITGIFDRNFRSNLSKS
jgi:anti-repressor protein